jgi:hypothetical protein
LEALTPDAQLVVLFGGMHLIAFLLGGVLFWMFLHSEPVSPWEPPDEEDGGGGGGNDRLQKPPKPPRPGGIPLPDAVQSRERFRGPGRLADRHRVVRRPQHAPAPARTPTRR